MGFDVLTYRKGQQSTWRARCVHEVAQTVDGRRVVYQLAERRVRLSHGLPVREVRRLTEDGHQTGVITSNDTLSTFEVAHRMFGRRRQEDFFRYMRHEFDLDHLCTYDVEPITRASCRTPSGCPWNNSLGRNRRRWTASSGGAAIWPRGGTLRVHGRSLGADEVDAWIQRQEVQIQRLAERRAALPKEVPLEQVLAPEQIVQLERERKLLTDVLKILAYRAESHLARYVGPLFARHEDETRDLLQSVFQATGDLFPDPDQGTLTVRFHGLCTPRTRRAMGGLCQLATAQQVCYPGTTLRLVFEAPECQRQLMEPGQEICMIPP
ncbi:MAG: putative transposase [Candidatus Latescibacterota bacterium]